jgi:large subunit ribosomal protein L35
MPKLKTHSGTKDRVRITKNGKVLRRHAGGSHFLQHKSAARKRRFAGTEVVDPTQVKSIKRNLGV